LYQIDLGTGGSGIAATTTVTNQNDGASCILADDPLPCSISVSATPSQCANGNYDLALQIIYNNVDSTSFTLVVNGVSQGYNYADYPSGHIFTIEDILGDGTTNIEVSISDDGNSDCQTTINYDEPICCIDADAGEDNSTNVCVGTTVDLSTLVSVAGGTFTDPGVTGGLSGSNFNTTGLSGSYNLIYTVTANDPCLDDTATITVNVDNPTEPTNLECWETATFDNTSCQWVVTGEQDAMPTIECWETNFR